MNFFLKLFQLSNMFHSFTILTIQFCQNVVQKLDHCFNGKIMPVKVNITPPPPANSKQPGVTKSLLYNGSKFQGHQKSKGNSYEVEVVLQVSIQTTQFSRYRNIQ